MGCGAPSKERSKNSLRLSLQRQVSPTGREVTPSASDNFKERYALGEIIAVTVGGTSYSAQKKVDEQKTVVVKKPRLRRYCREELAKHAWNKDLADLAALSKDHHHHAAPDMFEEIVSVEHPNLVKILDVFVSSVETFLVMEYSEGGNLFEAIRYSYDTFATISYSFIASAMQQTLTGLEYMHSKCDQCHNEVRPDNIFLERRQIDANDLPRCMLGDYGCISDLDDPFDADARYAAPELWINPEKGRVNFSTDVWAAGVTLFELLSGGLLAFTDHRNLSGWNAFVLFNDGTLRQKMESALLTLNAEINCEPIAHAGEEAANLCRGMLHALPDQRMTVSCAAEDSWFRILKGPVKPLPGPVAESLRQRMMYADIKQSLLALVAQKVHQDDLGYYKTVFEDNDQDRDGRLRMSEFIDIVDVPGITSGANEALTFFRMADVYHIGRVEFNEFIAVTFDPDGLAVEELEEKVLATFRRLACIPEENGNGHRIDGTASQATVFAEGPSQSQPEGKRVTLDMVVAEFPFSYVREIAGKLFTEMNVDSSTGVTYEEFKNFLAQM